MDIEDFLRQMYPKASNRNIAKYTALVRNFDTDKLPETAKVKKYRKLDSRIKELTAQKDALKKEILEIYKTLGHQVSGLNIISTSSRSYDGAKFYDWCAQNMSPELLEELTIKTIDEEKFSLLSRKGVIEYEELPEDTFTKKEGFRVDIEGSRRRKPKQAP